MKSKTRNIIIISIGVILLFTLLSHAQEPPNKDVSNELTNMDKSWSFGNGCDEPIEWVTFAPFGIEMNDKNLQLLKINLETPQITRYGTPYTVDELINEGFLELLCDYSTITIKDETLSVSTLNKDEIKVFPNPVIDRVNIVGDVKSIELFDMYGRKLAQVANPSQKNKMYLHNFASGIYILRVNGESKKIVIK